MHFKDWPQTMCAFLVLSNHYYPTLCMLSSCVFESVRSLDSMYIVVSVDHKTAVLTPSGGTSCWVTNCKALAASQGYIGNHSHVCIEGRPRYIRPMVKHSCCKPRIWRNLGFSRSLPRIHRRCVQCSRKSSNRRRNASAGRAARAAAGSRGMEFASFEETNYHLAAYLSMSLKHPTIAEIQCCLQIVTGRIKSRGLMPPQAHQR